MGHTNKIFKKILLKKFQKELDGFIYQTEKIKKVLCFTSAKKILKHIVNICQYNCFHVRTHLNM